MGDSKLIVFRNCRALRNHAILKEDIWVRNGKFVDPEKIFFDEKKKADITVDCDGALISPGFIDIQINGGFGCDFSNEIDDVEGSLSTVSMGLLRHGVTAYCPTVVTSPTEVYAKVLPKLKYKRGGKHGATILGAHVEGPFINQEKLGAHEEKYLRKFKDVQCLYDVYGSLDNIKIVTLAPELDNAMDIVKHLANNNIVVSLGHSAADMKIGELAVENGARLITHLFNAMLPFHHRDPGLIGLLVSDHLTSSKSIFFGIIADGHHTHASALRIAHRTHPKGLVLVTDANSTLGLSEGTHYIGQGAIEVRNEAAYIANTDILCGSISPLVKCLRKFKHSTDCSLVEAIESCTYHPAQVLNIEKEKGTLEYGADADMVFLSDDLEVLSTWIAGECVFSVSS